MTECYIATQRIDNFLSAPEPATSTTAAVAAADSFEKPDLSPPAAAAATGAAEASQAAPGTPIGASTKLLPLQQKPSALEVLEIVPESDTSSFLDQLEQDGTGKSGNPIDVVVRAGYVELGGADYDWNATVQQAPCSVSDLQFMVTCPDSC